MRRLTIDIFIEQAKASHSDKYDYDKVDYHGCDVKVKIICPEHGAFWQRAADHLRGDGCPLCRPNKKLTQKEFLQNESSKPTCFSRGMDAF